MKKPYVPANATLCAAAIPAAAMLKAPGFLSIVLLPMLATLPLLTSTADACTHRSNNS